MKKLRNQQLPLQASYQKSSSGIELQKIEALLEEIAGWEEFLVQVGEKLSDKGGASSRISVEQVVKAAIVKSLFDCSYRKLADLLVDSRAVGAFLGLQFDESFSRSTLHASISRVDADDWRELNRLLLCRGVELEVETGAVLRSDSTVTETNIHHPTDSSLIVDGIRVLTRLMLKLQRMEGTLSFSNHLRRAKSRLYEINNSSSYDERYPYYKDLLRVGEMVSGYVTRYLQKAKGDRAKALPPKGMALRLELQKNQLLMQRVLQQTFRRVIRGENVPAEEKVVSFYQPDTDIIKKGGRETLFGHKLSVTAGLHLIMGCDVLEGNPSDSTLVEAVLKEHITVYGYAPDYAAFDGGYCSQANRDLLKERGVEALTFCKHGSLPRETLCSSSKLHRELMNFRAGIEGLISSLKRNYGLRRIFETGRRRFASTVQRSVVAFNLRTMVRLL